jgi:predicted ester cyclase
MTSRNDELLRRWFTEIWNRGDIDAADQLLAPQGILHETAVGGDGIQSLADFKAMACSVNGPDIHFHVETTLQDGEHAAARVTVTGTHSGPGLGIAPTGRSFRITGIVMVRISDGRTVEGWSSFDMLGLFEQLGALKRPDMGGT